MSKQPMKSGLLLLRRIAPKEYRDELIGDLLERHAELEQRFGKRRAKLWLFTQVVSTALSIMSPRLFSVRYSPLLALDGPASGLWYEFRKGTVVGLLTTAVFLAITVPVQLWILQHVSTDVSANALRSTISLVKNQVQEGQSLFHPDVEISNPGPRTAVNAKILIKPISCAIRIQPLSSSTFPVRADIDFEEGPGPTGNCDSRIVNVRRLAPGQKLILHYVARSAEIFPTDTPMTLLTVNVQ